MIYIGRSTLCERSGAVGGPRLEIYFPRPSLLQKRTIDKRAPPERKSQQQDGLFLDTPFAMTTNPQSIDTRAHVTELPTTIFAPHFKQL
jgi:hypothetical protein